MKKRENSYRSVICFFYLEIILNTIILCKEVWHCYFCFRIQQIVTLQMIDILIVMLTYSLISLWSRWAKYTNKYDAISVNCIYDTDIHISRTMTAFVWITTFIIICSGIWFFIWNLSLKQAKHSLLHRVYRNRTTFFFTL